MGIPRRMISYLVVAVALGATGCATSPPDAVPEDIIEARRQRVRQAGPADCLVQDVGGTARLRAKYCWVEYGPGVFPRVQRSPLIHTYLDTPYGQISNPLVWTFGVTPEGDFQVTFPFTYPPAGQGTLGVEPPPSEQPPPTPPDFPEAEEEPEPEPGTSPPSGQSRDIE